MLRWLFLAGLPLPFDRLRCGRGKREAVQERYLERHVYGAMGLAEGALKRARRIGEKPGRETALALMNALDDEITPEMEAAGLDVFWRHDPAADLSAQTHLSSQVVREVRRAEQEHPEV